jgi:hydrogenase-4 component B
VVVVALQKTDVRSRLIYPCLAICSISCAQLLLGSVTVPASWLPVGLPWVGAHFRMDALGAVFLVII